MDFDNEADLETAELNRLGDISSKLKKKGICSHGWRKTLKSDPVHPLIRNENDLEKCLHW